MKIQWQLKWMKFLCRSKLHKAKICILWNSLDSQSEVDLSLLITLRRVACKQNLFRKLHCMCPLNKQRRDMPRMLRPSECNNLVEISPLELSSPRLAFVTIKSEGLRLYHRIAFGMHSGNSLKATGC